ncbi:hypothetical protein [uncultured Allofournierella sp.]|uniref:hypothetical protein n=1 Tax=uncultured Allofournierella sp. TaxID=1940258 RepID=UPI0037536B81
MMVLLSGLLGLAGITVFSTALALLLECAVPLLLMPVIGGSVVWLCLWGFVGLLPVGGWLFYLGAAAAGVWLVLCRKKQLLPQLAQPGLWVFWGVSIGFLLLFFATQPEFAHNDEFTLWGSAAKLTCIQDVLHPAAKGNLLARSAMPGMMLVVYLFEFFVPGFSEWGAYFAYNAMLAAAVAAVVGGVRSKRWQSTVLLCASAFLLPYFFSVPNAGGLSTVYLTVLGDLPLGMVFGAAVCLYFALEGKACRLPVLAVTLAFLTLIKDMGLAYSCIVAMLCWLDGVFCGSQPLGRRVAVCSGHAVVMLLPVGAFYLGWSRYVSLAAGLDKSSVGSGEGQTSLAGAMLSGVMQLVGLEPATENFVQIRNSMLRSPVNIPICLLGGGVLALGFLALVLAGIWLCSSHAQHRQAVVLSLGALLGLVVFLVFHLFLYVFNFQPEEALQLKDYARYIGPYYVGVAFMLLGQLALAAKPQARLVQVGLAAVLCILFVWRGMPLAGFWNYPHTIYSVRDDVKSRAEQVNDLLNWEDTVLLISQGDDVTRWNYYGFDLNATLAKGFAGNGYGPQLEEGTDWWMTTHMNLVDPNSQQSMYAYSTLCTPEDLKRFLQDMRYDYILVDESDEYIAQVIGPAFGVNDLPDQRTDQVILLRVEYTGDTVRLVRQEGVTP